MDSLNDNEVNEPLIFFFTGFLIKLLKYLYVAER